MALIQYHKDPDSAAPEEKVYVVTPSRMLLFLTFLVVTALAAIAVFFLRRYLVTHQLRYYHIRYAFLINTTSIGLIALASILCAKSLAKQFFYKVEFSKRYISEARGFVRRKLETCDMMKVDDADIESDAGISQLVITTKERGSSKITIPFLADKDAITLRDFIRRYAIGNMTEASLYGKPSSKTSKTIANDEED